jgi:hypothetical protein
VEGSPKTPLPITEFTTSAVRLQRPMARTNCWSPGTCERDSGTGCFYHKWALSMTTVAAGAGLRPGLDSRGGCRYMIVTGDLRLKPKALTVPAKNSTRRNVVNAFRGYVKSRANSGVWSGDFFADQSNAQNYQRRMPVGHLFATRCR